MSHIDFDMITFGCKVNVYDSGLIEKKMAAQGFTSNKQSPRVFVFNTCAVTSEATAEALKSIRKIKSKHPFATIVVTGCGAQVDTQQYEAWPGVDLVVANSHKHQLSEILEDYFKGKENKVYKSNIFRQNELGLGGGSEKAHTRAFLKIQDGCNSFCSYCIIPFARGKSRSLPIEHLLERVSGLYAEGVREVVITGIHLGDYSIVERKRVLTLEDLVERLLLKTQMPRFRISSIEPLELSERLLDLYSDTRLCPHFHMSIQSAASKTLKDMKRQYQAEDVEASLNKISQKLSRSFVGMDIIVGFPTETEADFQETFQRLKELPWTRIHVFPYSQRVGTRAATIPSLVSKELKNERAKMLRALSSERYLAAAQAQVGTSKQTLVLRSQKKTGGLSDDYWPILFNCAEGDRGKIIQVKVTGVDQSSSSRLDPLLRGEKLHST